jgi:hypothetical protein
MVINSHITKEQLDSLRTNPSIQLTFPTQDCFACKTSFQIRLVKLGSQTDMAYDSHEYALEKLFQDTAGEALRGLFKIKLPRKARVRIEAVHFPDLYAGKQILLPGRCPVCQHELVILLKKT